MMMFLEFVFLLDPVFRDWFHIVGKIGCVNQKTGSVLHLARKCNNSSKVFFGRRQIKIDAAIVRLDRGFRLHYILQGKIRVDKLTL